MGRIKKKELPKEVSQSYYITSARYNFSVYEKRILYRIVELIQSELKGQSIGKGISIEPTLYGDQWITMPVSHFLRNDEEDNNYYQVKKAFHRLNKISIEYEDERIWEVFSVVQSAKLFKYDSMVKFKIAEGLYKDLLNFSKGYSQYELSVAFNFKSQYTMRFYEMFSRSKLEKITYSIEKLKKIFCLEDRYNQGRDFFLKVIDPAQKELENSKAPYYFTYDKIKIGRAYRNIDFYIFYRPSYDGTIKEQTSIRWDVTPQLIRLLEEGIGATTKELKPHTELLIKIDRLDCYDQVKKLLRSSQNAKSKIGYTINGFKKIVAQSKE